jgi:uncharacterized membrane protein YfcA
MPEFDTLFWAMGAMSLAAGLMRGFAGFGSALMLSPLLSLYYGPVAAVLIIGIMEIAVSVQLLPRAVKEAQWPLVIPVTASAIVFMPLGVWLLTVLDGQVLATIIAIIVLIFVFVLASGWRYSGAQPLPATLGIGAVCGTLISSTSIGGPPFLIYMMAGKQTAKQVRANIIIFFAVLELIIPFMLWAGGKFEWGLIIQGAFYCPTYLLGAWLGSRMFRESSETLYRRIALIILSVVAIYGLVTPLL